MTQAAEPARVPAAPDAPPAPPPAPAKKAGPLDGGDGLPGTHDIKKEANPFTDGDWRMLVYAWAGLLVRFVLILGAVFSVYQFLAAREEKRVERALELVELWEGPDYQAAQKALKQRLADLNARYASLLGDKPSDSDRAVYLERIGLEALSADGGAMPLAEFQEHFDKLVYFLNRMAFCVAGDICSRKVVDPYFRDYAVSFWSYFSGHVARQRRTGSTTYAAPIETYVVGDAKPAAAQR